MNLTPQEQLSQLAKQLHDLARQADILSGSLGRGPEPIEEVLNISRALIPSNGFVTKEGKRITRQKWSDQDRSDAVKLALQGFSPDVIAQKLGRKAGAPSILSLMFRELTPEQYDKWARSMPSRGARRLSMRRWTEEEDQNLIEWFTAGQSIQTIAKKLQRTSAAVVRHFEVLNQRES